MPSRLQRLTEFLGFSSPTTNAFDDMDSMFLSESDDEFGPKADFIYEADPITSLEITDPARILAEYDFPDLNVSQNIDYSAFSRFTELSSDRKTQYAAYDTMTQDPIISSALEMYADDATQYDNQGRLIWSEGDDTDLIDYIDRLLETLGIGKKLWAIYYNLALYGDVYLRLFKQTSEIYANSADYPYTNIYDQMKLDENILDVKSKYLPYVELVDDPENVYELVKNGKTVQYAYVSQLDDLDFGRPNANRVELYPPDQFIHIYIENPHSNTRERFSFQATDPETNVTKTYSFQARRGKSMLQDVYPVERQVQLLENALLLNRISRSAITRLVQIEVGDMPKPEINHLTRRLKTKLEAKLSINADEGNMKNYLSSSGIDNLIVSPTRNGKGGVTVETIQADPDIKSIADIDYFTDKRFGALRIPKAFMGYDESLSANSGGTLAQLDARYGRSVKKLQTCVVAGITDLVNLFLLHDNRFNDIGEFKIRVVSPTTADDLARDENLRNRLSIVSDILNMFDEDSGVDRTALFQHLITSFIGDSRLSDEIYRQRKEKLRQRIEGEVDGDNGLDNSNFTDFSDIDPNDAAPDEDDDTERGPSVPSRPSVEGRDEGGDDSDEEEREERPSRSSRPSPSRNQTPSPSRQSSSPVGSSEIDNFI